MQNISTLISKFRYAAASFSRDGVTNRFFVELENWDNKNGILWVKFPKNLTMVHESLTLKCVNKDENLYVIIKGNFENKEESLHYIKRSFPPFSAFYATDILIAEKLDLGEGVTDMKIIERIDLREAELEPNKRYLEAVSY